MLKFKKILPIVCAAAVIFAGCGSDAPAADDSAGSDTGSVVEENVDEALSVDEDMTDEDAQQADGGDAESAEEQQAAGAENDAKASGSESKAEASKSASAAKTETKSETKTETKKSAKSDTSKPAASANTASSGSSSAAPAAAKPAEPAYKYKDGTYSGSAQGFNGPVGVSVTISKDKITAVSVTSSTDDEPYISNAKALCSHIVSSNSADVSGVSGATYSSNGIKGAVKAALAKAKN